MLRLCVSCALVLLVGTPLVIADDWPQWKEPTRDGFDEISRVNGVTWAHPVFANEHVDVRSDKEVACASLAKR